MADFAALKADMMARLGKTEEALKKDFTGLRTGRANPALLDTIMVDAYGSMVPLNQMYRFRKRGCYPFLCGIKIWSNM